MSGVRGWKQGCFLAVLITALAVGCGTKQAVKSTESAPPQEGSAAAQGSPTEARSGAPGQESIATETVKPGAGAPAAETIGGQTGTEVARAGAAEAAGIAATEERPSGFEDIHFDYDKALIREDAKPVLSQIAVTLKKGNAVRLVVEGHCDERGTAEYNMALGERRAEAARAYLVSLGVRKDALSTVSFGKEKPLDPDHTEGAWAKNRRAHFVKK